MFAQVAFKWLSITVIVLAGFLVVLLFLGYLLKENEITTTKLKIKLEQEAIQQQAKEARKKQPFSHLTKPLTTAEKSQKKIIIDNQNCESDLQCFLVHTHNQAIGCIVSVNTQGAAILLKVAAQYKSSHSFSQHCQQEYLKQRSSTAQCQKKRCSF